MLTALDDGIVDSFCCVLDRARRDIVYAEASRVSPNDTVLNRTHFADATFEGERVVDLLPEGVGRLRQLLAFFAAS